MKRLFTPLPALSRSGFGTIMNLVAGTCPIISYPHFSGGAILEVGAGLWVSPLNFIFLLLDLPFTLGADTVTPPVMIFTAEIYEEKRSIGKPKSKKADSR
jgi:hypothetical protein